MKKAVVLLSGGLDSACTIFLAREQGYKCLALFFDYGQRHKREIVSARKIALRTSSEFRVVRLKFDKKGSLLLDGKKALPSHRQMGIPGTYVPARNIVFLSVALSYAESMNADAVFIGAHTGDYSGYPDCRPEFFRAFEKVKNTGMKNGKRIKIMTPLIRMNKTQIISAGMKLNVPFEDTWSCYEGGLKPCGKCDSCYYRKTGFSRLGMEDPLIK